MRHHSRTLQQLWPSKLRGCAKSIQQLSPAAILLGASLNLLEAVSIGLLIFPPAEHSASFSGLQDQAMSMYIIRYAVLAICMLLSMRALLTPYSTVVSQVVLTFGGSGIPSALGSMLAEALPFLRGIASSIQRSLGDDHPGILPTTMVAYAMTSVLLGAVFLFLAALRCGNLAGYFPQTIMTGVIGAVGVSLFRVGLEVTLPPTSPHLSFSTLFASSHLPLLATSVASATFLLLTTRVAVLKENWVTKNLTQHPLYIPLFCVAVGGVFWIVVAAHGDTDLGSLANNGWLFMARGTRRHAAGTSDWNYWRLFDLTMVEWRAISSGARDIILLVVIGSLSLPIFASAAALEMKVPEFSMNQELLGNGISNVVSGAVGALPNLFVYSNTRFFHRADGRRHEAVVVILFTFASFFYSSQVLPYVPTILASTLILFIGMELMTEALWVSSKRLVWNEWVTAASTTLASTFAGFAPGIGVGLAIMILLQYCDHLKDTRPQIIHPHLCTVVSGRAEIDEEQQTSPALPPLDFSSMKELDLSVQELKQPPLQSRLSDGCQIWPPLIRLNRHSSSTTIPPLAKFMEDMRNSLYDTAHYIILDLRTVDTLETCVAQFLSSLASWLLREPQRRFLVVITFPRSTRVIDVLEREGLVLRWPNAKPAPADSTDPTAPLRIPAYERLDHAVRVSRAVYLHATATGTIDKADDPTAYDDHHIVQDLLTCLPDSEMYALERLNRAGLVVRTVRQGEAISCARYPLPSTFVVLNGKAGVQQLHASLVNHESQKPVREAVSAAFKFLFMWLFRRKNGCMVKGTPVEKYLTVGDRFDGEACASFCVHAISETCCILDIDPTNEVGWSAVQEQSARATKL